MDQNILGCFKGFSDCRDAGESGEILPSWCKKKLCQVRAPPIQPHKNVSHIQQVSAKTPHNSQIMSEKCILWAFLRIIVKESRDGAVLRVLASHQCIPDSIPRPGAICGLSLLLVLALAPRVFLRVLWFSSLVKNRHF